MVTTPEGRSIGEHDWHSSDYVDWWIHRDLGRDAGFARVECLWRQAPLATMKAVKSGG